MPVGIGGKGGGGIERVSEEGLAFPHENIFNNIN